MDKKWIPVIAIGAGVVFLLAGWIFAPAPTVDSEALAAMSPDAVTEAFYTWYLDYMNSDVLCHPLLDGAYRSSPYLSTALIAHFDSLVDQACGYGLPADPFLCTKGVPLHISVVPLSSTDKTARVLVRGSYPTESEVITTENLAEVTLVREDGRWVISGTTCR